MGDRRVEYTRLADVKYAPRNPKGHNAEGISRSISHHGLAELPLVDERTGLLVAGHGRVERLRAMRDNGNSPPDGVKLDDDGEWLTPIVRGWASRSDEDAEAYLIGSNQLAAMGGWDDHGLAEILHDLADAQLLELTGFTDDDLALLVPPPSLDDLAKEYGEPGEDDLWPVLRFKVPPTARDDFYDITDGGDSDDTARFLRLIERAKAAG